MDSGPIPLKQDLISQLNQYIDAAPYKAAEQALADASVVEVKNKGALPLSKSVKRLHLYMPDALRCEEMKTGIHTIRPDIELNCVSMASDKDFNVDNLSKDDIVIIGDITPQQSLAEMGGMDDMENWHTRPDPEIIKEKQIKVAKHAKALGNTVVFVSMRTPYILAEFEQLSDAQLAIFTYNSAPVFLSLAKVIFGEITATGSLPVTLPKQLISNQ